MRKRGGRVGQARGIDVEIAGVGNVLGEILGMRVATLGGHVPRRVENCRAGLRSEPGWGNKRGFASAHGEAASGGAGEAAVERERERPWGG